MLQTSRKICLFCEQCSHQIRLSNYEFGLVIALQNIDSHHLKFTR